MACPGVLIPFIASPTIYTLLYGIFQRLPKGICIFCMAHTAQEAFFFNRVGAYLVHTVKAQTKKHAKNPKNEVRSLTTTHLIPILYG
jgi:hypothetical protein